MNILTNAQIKPKAVERLKQLETIFKEAPDSIQTSIYWYWVSDNISKYGVIKDLEAMKKVGINRVFIGNIGLDDVPYGKVKMFSAEWWDILHTALKTATKLGLDVGIFNSPGWSQSGGPWVKPEQSMRYLTSSEMHIKGPAFLNGKLDQPGKDFQDVKVIAYPAPKGYNSDFRKLNLKLTSKPAIDNLNYIIDDDETTQISLADNFIIEFTTDKLYTARSLLIFPSTSAAIFEGDIQVKNNNVYKTIKHFVIDRSNTDLNAGFKPYAPGAIAIPATTATEFRIVFTRATAKSGVNKIKFSSAPVLDDYVEKTLAKTYQTPFLTWGAYQWLPQPAVEDNYVINPDKVIDISNKMSADGTLRWRVPKGDWIIERTGMAPTLVKNTPATPEGKGLEADKMSKKHITAHFDAFLGEIIKRIPAEDRKSWKITVEDSYEAGSQNWTDHLIAKFRNKYGYNPIPYLPVMHGKVVGSADRSDRFLWDLRRFIADDVAYEYVAGLREISHKHGLATWLENYGHFGFPGEFLQYGGQSDEVSGEFWSEGDLGNIENRAASSCAHIYGKTKVSAESFTCAGNSFSRYPALMKQRADRFFTEGINSTLLHVYIQQPYENKLPGLNAWFGNEFNRNNTWFYDMDIFLKYIKRCNMLLQQGKYVADVAYFIGEDAPKMTGSQNPALPAGYSFDYINAEVLKTRTVVKDGKLTLPDGMQYSILVLPELTTMRPEFLLKIKELVNQGAVVLGHRPLNSPSLQNYGKADLEVQRLSNDLWGKTKGSTLKINSVGKGVVMDGMNLEEALQQINIKPDFTTAAADSTLFIHRELKEGPMYFISNQKNTAIKIKAKFRVIGKKPQLWDAVNGYIRDLPEYTQSDGATTIPLALAPFESAFIVFSDGIKDSKPNQVNYPEASRTIAVLEPWQVTFDSKMRGPSKAVVFKQLEDWTLNKIDSIKYFSGPAYYQNTFELSAIKAGERAILDLGNLIAMAKVKVNGIEVGGAWTAPYQIDVTKAIKPGKNELEIKVVNTWVNRLIGDSRLFKKDRKTWVSQKEYNRNSRLEPSGLFGPVNIKIID